MGPVDFPQYRHRGRDKTQASDEATRTLRNVERNMEALTRFVPMEIIDDLPVGMQRHVVGVPRTWVFLFRSFANTVLCYDRAHMPRA